MVHETDREIVLFCDLKPRLIFFVSRKVDGEGKNGLHFSKLLFYKHSNEPKTLRSRGILVRGVSLWIICIHWPIINKKSVEIIKCKYEKERKNVKHIAEKQKQEWKKHQGKQKRLKNKKWLKSSMEKAQKSSMKNKRHKKGTCDFFFVAFQNCIFSLFLKSSTCAFLATYSNPCLYWTCLKCLKI